MPGAATIKCALDTEADLQCLVSGESAKENTDKEKRLSLGISGKKLINTTLSTGSRPVLGRILQAYGFSSQKELSQYIEISTGTISTWVRRRFFLVVLLSLVLRHR
ncbi:helix-turn-helix domain-containing protein [Pectobacterium polaris]|nr:helix-turn-helix domain-containing protein [Pectobacterium polaris]